MKKGMGFHHYPPSNNANTEVSDQTCMRSNLFAKHEDCSQALNPLSFVSELDLRLSNQIEGISCKLSVLSPYKIEGDKI
jgi:hypothetical protein